MFPPKNNYVYSSPLFSWGKTMSKFNLVTLLTSRMIKTRQYAINVC